MSENFKIPDQADDSDKRMAGKLVGERGEGFAELLEGNKDEEKILLMPSEEIKKRLMEISEQYGIDLKSLARLLVGSKINGAEEFHGRKNARRKFKRYLKGSDSTFEKLAEIFRINKECLGDKDGDDYLNFIKSKLSDEGFNQYLHGKWTEEILRIVSIAQKKFGYGARSAPSPAEVSHRAKFAPNSEYRGYFNR